MGVKEPHVQWIYKSNFDTVVEDEEKKFLLNSDVEKRTVFYEETDRMSQRWALELNDYAPLLANRWDKKHQLATYLMDKNNQKIILETIKKPGGVKQIFINAGIIAPSPVKAE